MLSIEKCLEMCGLIDYAKAAFRSLSTEYKKCTMIGVELAAKVCHVDIVLCTT